MMRSMFSGVSGLKVHQTKMDVIGNNIANVNTVGYKSQRVTFSDVFSQTISGASAASDDTGRGGVNPMQVGLGVNVSSIDMLMTQGAAQRTDNPFDVMVNGDGFIVVGDASGRYFTRAGALRLDEAGNLVIPNGMKVKGWLATDSGNGEYEVKAQEVQDINLFDPKIQSAEPTMTTKVQLAGNICNTDTSKTVTVSFYDSLGNYYTAPLQLTKGANAGEWNLAMATTSVKDPTTGQSVDKLVFTDAKGNHTDVITNDPFQTTIKFDANGKLDAAQATTLDVDISGVKNPSGSSFTDKLSIDLSGLTQYATQSTAAGKIINGNSAGTLSGYSIGDDGIITATYTNGDKRTIAQVAIAEFDNPAGLEKVGDNLYSTTTNSGEFDGVGKVGVFKTGVLEMSNVDLSAEFTDMIITQRGFQANSRIITVSDEMLQELTNLKR